MEPKIYKDNLDVYYGGISDDKNIQKPEISRATSHIDIWSGPKRMTPYRAMEADQNASDAAKVFSIVMFRYLNAVMYGLGIVIGGAKAKIYEKTVDPITGSWAASISGEDGGGSRSMVCFMDFHDYLYGGSAASRIWAYGDVTGSPSFTSTAYSITNGGSAQGLVTSDDLLLIPCGNVMAKKNGAGSGPTDGWTAPLVLPDNFTIVDQCEFGDKVAVGASNISGNSKVFIWDKVNQDPEQVIDWGEGDLRILDNIEGQLVGVSTLNTQISGGGKMVVRVWEGGSKANQKFELKGDENGGGVVVYGNHCKLLDGNRLVFGVRFTSLEGVDYNQLFAIGRKSNLYPLAYTFDRRVNNDTAITNAIQGLYKIADCYFVAYQQDGSINRTNDQAVYVGVTATHITQKLDGSRQAGVDAIRKRKVLTMAGLLFEELTSGQSVSLYWRPDSKSTWRLIRTFSTVGEVSFEAGIQADSGDFSNCRRFQFKATSINGAIITGIPYAFKVLDADVISP